MSEMQPVVWCGQCASVAVGRGMCSVCSMAASCFDLPRAHLRLPFLRFAAGIGQGRWAKQVRHVDTKYREYVF